jgi:hypothetical protein
MGSQGRHGQVSGRGDVCGVGSRHSSVGDEVEVELDVLHLGLGYREAGVECVMGVLDDGGFGGGPGL